MVFFFFLWLIFLSLGCFSEREELSMNFETRANWLLGEALLLTEEIKIDTRECFRL